MNDNPYASSGADVPHRSLPRSNVYGLMLKYPEPGSVKSRLAESVGPEAACCVSRRLAELVVANTRPSGGEYERILLYAPGARQESFASWFPGEDLLAQRGPDVGLRMSNAISDLLACGADRVVLTGADIPLLTVQIIAAAFTLLEHADLVIGPAEDGGYYLIGMKTLYPEVFEGIAWSTGSVCRETVLRAERLGLRLATTPTLADLDRVEDLERFRVLLFPPKSELEP